MELHPFHTSTGACLFTWQQSQKQLTSTKGDVEFRCVKAPSKHCFTGLMTHWQCVCETVAQQKKNEDRRTPSSSKCLLL